MSYRGLVIAVGLGCASCGATGPHPIAVTPVDAGTTSDLVSVWCTPSHVYAIDAQGGAHDLDGGGVRLSWDRGGPVASTEHRLYQVAAGQLLRSDDEGARWTALQPPAPTDVSYGRGSPAAVAAGRGGPLFVLGRYTAISNSLESSYAYLVRSDDRGATWSRLWVGPDEGPIGIGRRNGPDVAAALAVLPGGAVALAAVDGSVLISTDGGHTFEARRPPGAAPLRSLWTGPGGALYGVGSRGTIAVSTDAGQSFRAVTSHVDRDLLAITGCRGHVWIVGAAGTALRD